MVRLLELFTAARTLFVRDAMSGWHFAGMLFPRK
jgi:hypothetical protein